MAHIPLEALESGMILKTDVCDRSGRLLLPAGAELTDKMLKVFRTWGITHADIQRDADETPGDECETDLSLDPILLAEAEQSVAQLFRHNDPEHPMIRELMRVCLDRRVANGC